MLYGRPQSERLQRLRQTRKNDYLELPATVQVTDDLERVVNHSAYLLVAIGAGIDNWFCGFGDVRT